MLVTILQAGLVSNLSLEFRSSGWLVGVVDSFFKFSLLGGFGSLSELSILLSILSVSEIS